MSSPNLVCALALVFITGMVWLRTRMHYRRAQRQLRLTRAGWTYFTVLLAVLALGWLLAPAVAQRLWPSPMNTPLLARVVWFLVTYYLFIPAHQALRTQGVEVFKSAVADVQEHG
jgi:cytochrome bd-type quinol oxidase subunit 2